MSRTGLKIFSMVAKRIVSFKLELITAAALLMLIGMLRVYHLDADPPTGLSISSDVETDPPQYTLFARNYVQSGDFDPFDDVRRTVFLKSAVTAAATVVFGLMGTGLWQSNFVGLLYSLGALFLFWLFLRRVAGPLPGLLFLLLISVNYNLLFYGRLPFLEHALAFFAFLALVLMVYARRRWLFIPAGMALAVGIFFGKVLGLVFLFPFACYFAYAALFPAKDEDRERWLPPLLFGGGFAVIMAAWYFITYLPSQSQVAGYYGEQAISLYGAPDGLKSIDDFFRKVLTFGIDSKLFPRMRVVGLLATVFLGMMLFLAARVRTWRDGFGSFNAGHIFLATMIIAFYGSLMIWNYRPLRYQLVLIYPLYGAAAIVLGMLWQRWREARPTNTPYLFYLIGTVLFMIPTYQVWEGLADRYGWGFYYDDGKYVAAILGVLLTAAIGLYLRYQPFRQFKELALAMRIVVLVVLGATLVFGLLDYHFWYSRATFTSRDNGRDLALMLSDGAVLSGPHAPLLGLGGDHDVVIHMFGVAEADPELFTRFPITHLLLDESNEKLARADYPDIMDSALHLVTYHVGLDKVRLFRIAGHTGNSDATRYQWSLPEQMIGAYKTDQVTLGNELAARLLGQYPENLSIYLAVAEVAAANRQIDLAESSFKKAIEFSPTNYHLNSRLAQFYKELYIETERRQYKEQGLAYFEESIRLAPTVHKMQTAYRELKEKEAWQLKADTISSFQS